MKNLLSMAIVLAIFAWCMTLASKAADICPPSCMRASEVPPSPTWHLFTKSRGGTVSLIKNLTEHECQFVRARALGLPATDAEKAANTAATEKWFKEHPGETVMNTGWRMGSPGDIETAECFE
jgi:hypothetical protein